MASDPLQDQLQLLLKSGSQSKDVLKQFRELTQQPNDEDQREEEGQQDYHEQGSDGDGHLGVSGSGRARYKKYHGRGKDGQQSKGGKRKRKGKKAKGDRNGTKKTTEGSEASASGPPPTRKVTTNFYIYTDKHGQQHIVDQVSQVPKRYRRKMQIVALDQETAAAGKNKGKGDTDSWNAVAGTDGTNGGIAGLLKGLQGGDPAGIASTALLVAATVVGWFFRGRIPRRFKLLLGGTAALLAFAAYLAWRKAG